MKAVRCLLPLCVLIAGGCVTDELAVFEDDLLSSEEMKALMGEYVWTEMKGRGEEPEKPKEGKLVLEQRGPRYFFAMSELADDGKRGGNEGYFMLSKIPGSKANLLLLSCPHVSPRKPYAIDNLFLVVKVEKNVAYGWLVMESEPVAKGRLTAGESGSNGYDADELKDFLTKYADAYVLANHPNLTFQKK